MKIVGLTGGIGCGKTTVGQLFEAHDVPMIDADHVAHELSQPGQLGWKRIVERWGERFLKSDQTVDRSKLRAAVFESPEIKSELEAFLHPLIFNVFQEKTAYYRQLGVPYLIWSIPLLIESKRYRHLVERLLVIDVPTQFQINRVTARGISESTVLAILKTQASRKQRQEAANDLIINTGSITILADMINQLHRFYLCWALHNQKS